MNTESYADIMGMGSLFDSVPQVKTLSFIQRWGEMAVCATVFLRLYILPYIYITKAVLPATSSCIPTSEDFSKGI